MTTRLSGWDVEQPRPENSSQILAVASRTLLDLNPRPVHEVAGESYIKASCREHLPRPVALGLGVRVMGKARLSLDWTLLSGVVAAGIVLLNIWLMGSLLNMY